MPHVRGFFGRLASFLRFRPSPAEPTPTPPPSSFDDEWVQTFLWNREARWSDRPTDH